MSIPATVPPPLSALEVASGVVVGAARPAHDFGGAGGTSPRAALEAAILPALRNGPCVVTFSGGRDSSAMLALAVHVARREGLPLPVAATVRFADAPDSREDEWQERVIAHVRPADWQHVAVSDELDVIGPIARTALRRHGVLYPFNAHSYLPLMPYAAGGTLVTGLDGDGLLNTWSAQHVAELLSRRRRWQPRDLLRVALLHSPRPLKRRVLSRRLLDQGTWLTPPAERQAREAEARELADEPLRWDLRVPWWRSRRYLALTEYGGDLLAADAGVSMSHPLLDGDFLAALAAAGGRHGPGDRTAAMRALTRDVLPDDILARTSKASFDEAFFGPHTREFVDSWTGDGIDTELVDADRLRAAWHRPRIPLGTALLLQAAWLAADSPLGQGRQQVNRLGQAAEPPRPA